MSKKWIGSISLLFLVVSVLFFSYIQEIKTYRYNKERNIITTNEFLDTANRFLREILRDMDVSIKIKYIDDFSTYKDFSNDSIVDSSKLYLHLVIYIKKEDLKKEYITEYKTRIFMNKKLGSVYKKDIILIRYLHRKDINFFGPKKMNRIKIILNEAIRLIIITWRWDESDLYDPEITVMSTKIFFKPNQYYNLRKEILGDSINLSNKEKMNKLVAEFYRLTEKISLIQDKINKKGAQLLSNMLKSIKNGSTNNNSLLKQYCLNRDKFDLNDFFTSRPNKRLSIRDKYFGVTNKRFDIMNKYRRQYVFYKTKALVILSIIKVIQKGDLNIVNITKLEEDLKKQEKYIPRRELASLKKNEFMIRLKDFFDGNFTEQKESILAYIVSYTRLINTKEAEKIYLKVCDLRRVGKKAIKEYPDDVLKSKEYTGLLLKLLINPYRLKVYKDNLFYKHKQYGITINYFIYYGVELYLGVSGLYILYVLVFLSVGISRISKKRRIRKVKEELREKAKEKREKKLKAEKDKFLEKVKSILEDVKREKPDHSILNKEIEEITEEELYEVEAEIIDINLKREQKAKDRKKEEGNIKEASELLKEIQDAEILKELTNKLEEIKEELKTTNRPKKLDRKITKLIKEIEEAITKQD